MPGLPLRSSLRNLQLIDRRRRVFLRQLDEAILVEVGEYEPGIAKMILIEVLRPVPGDRTSGILRHHAAIRGINGLQFPVMVLDARGVAHRSELPVPELAWRWCF